MFYIIGVLLLMYLYELYNDTTNMVVSTVDGVAYPVENYKNNKNAADILARLNIINETIIDYMQQKYKDDHSIDAEFLDKNYDGGALSEHVPRGTKNVSYVLNKGQSIKLCLRDKETGTLHDFNTLVYVNLHELSHCLDKNYGHNPSFWRSFRKVLDAAVHLNLYKPVDYSKYPVKYCGIMIKNNIYFM